MRISAIAASAALALVAAVANIATASAHPGLTGLGDTPVAMQLEQSDERPSAGSNSSRGGRRARSSGRSSVSTASFGGGSFSGSGSVGPRPGKWCGWWMRTQLGGGPHLNLAWNWRNYGSSTSPQVGAVVVWRHHVGMITGQASNGQWIVKSGNDGNRVRERARSVSGAIFRI